MFGSFLNASKKSSDEETDKSWQFTEFRLSRSPFHQSHSSFNSPFHPSSSTLNRIHVRRIAPRTPSIRWDFGNIISRTNGGCRNLYCIQILAHYSLHFIQIMLQEASLYQHHAQQQPRLPTQTWRPIRLTTTAAKPLYHPLVGRRPFYKY